MQSRRIGGVLREARWLAIWFTGNPVVVAVHAFAIAGLPAIDGGGASGASVVATSPVIASLRCPLAHHADVNCDFLRVAHESLLLLRIRHCPAATHYCPDQTSCSEITADRRGSPLRAPCRRSVASWLMVASAPSHGVDIPPTGKRRVRGRPKLARSITWRLREPESNSRGVALDRSKLAEKLWWTH